jgi:hypothetical protein
LFLLQPLHSVHGRSLLVTRAVLFPNCYLDVYNITYKEANCNRSFCDRTMAMSIVNEKEAKCICIRSRVPSVGGRMVLSLFTGLVFLTWAQS